MLAWEKSMNRVVQVVTGGAIGVVAAELLLDARRRQEHRRRMARAWLRYERAKRRSMGTAARTSREGRSLR